MVFQYLSYALNSVNSNCPLLRFDGKVALLSVWQLFSADLSATYKQRFWQELREIHEEKEKRLIRCVAKLNGFRYELACKLDEDGKLLLCLLEGSKGWQFSFYDETLEPQWSNLREILSMFYGPKRSSLPLPPLHKVPMGDPGGYVTDTWELSDRIVLLTVQAFQVKDCCTKRMVDYSGCTLLIQPK